MAVNFADHISIGTSHTLARYIYVDDPTYNGNDIPGAPKQVMATEIKYTHPSGFSVAPSVEWIPQSYFLDSPDNAAGKWFEPAEGRAFYAGLRWTH